MSCRNRVTDDIRGDYDSVVQCYSTYLDDHKTIDNTIQIVLDRVRKFAQERADVLAAVLGEDYFGYRDD